MVTGYYSITWQLTGKLYPFSSDKKAIIAPIFSRLYHSIACFSAKLKDPVCTKSGATCSWGPASSPECRCELCHSDDTNWGTQVGAHFLSGEKFAGKRQLLPQTFQLDHLTPRVSRDYCICHVITASVTWQAGHGTLPWLQSPVTPEFRPGPGSQLSELCW